jgi:phage tail P2-like protein
VTTLLPPNATPLERAIENATARIGDLDARVDTLLDPAAIDATLLPWLAWGLSVDIWDPAWADSVKRDAIAGSIALHRIKGTRLALEQVLARHDQLLRVVEWFEAAPPRAPHTFDVILPLVTIDGASPDPTRSSAEFAAAIVADITRVKPLREHFHLVQHLYQGGGFGLIGAARIAAFHRADTALTADTDPIWPRLLQTEDGEPLEDDTGDFLEDSQ